MNQFGYGQQEPEDSMTDFNVMHFVVKQLLGAVCTATVVQIKKVTNAGGVSPVGLLDVQPLVNMVDGAGNATAHGTIFNLPYFRLQGGADAIILDPKVGDLGLAIFADRDISAVKTTKARANPGSSRRFDWADGLYLGGFLNGVPTQYIRFFSGGIEMVSPTKVKIQAPTIELAGNVASTGTLTNNGKAVGSMHTHTGVTVGAGISGPPS